MLQNFMNEGSLLLIHLSPFFLLFDSNKLFFLDELMEDNKLICVQIGFILMPWNLVSVDLKKR